MMQKMRWNQDWQFWQDHNSFALLWNVPETAKKVNLPHDAMLEQPANPQSSNGGNTGYRDGGTYIYTKNLFVAKDEKDHIFQLKFEGVYMNTFVFVNGQLAAKRPYGYSTFYVELNKFLQYDADNEIRVQVKTGATPNSRWYSGAGIIRDVYLLTSAKRTYLQPDALQITTQQANKQQATVMISAIVHNQTTEIQDQLQLNTQIFDENNNLVIQDSSPIVINSQDQQQWQQRLSWLNPQLWSGEDPHLYRCVVQLTDLQQAVVDQMEAVFGVRILTLDAHHGLQVNGQTVKLRGAGIHHDSGLLGAATYDVAAYRQIKLLKQAGFNAIRMAHQPAAASLLRACDELGMYVMDETFDMWNRSKSDYDYGLYFQEWWQADVRSMVAKDFNHPSVVMYSIGNEIPEIATNQGVQLSAQISQLIQQLDPTRYTLAAVNGLFSVGNDLIPIVERVAKQQNDSADIQGNVNDFMTAMNQYLDQIIVDDKISHQLDKVFATTDIAGYNYMTARYEHDVQAHPQRLLIGTETYPPQIGENWPLVQKHNQIIGDFTWTGWDYIGEAGVGIPGYQFGEGGFGAQYPAQLAYVGDLDITGFRRPLSYYREIVFGRRQKPYIAVQNPHHYGETLQKTPWMLSDTISSWTWDVKEHAPIIVEVYSPGTEVELRLNQQVIARKPVADSFRTLFELEYLPGQLTAVAYNHDQELGSYTLQTATKQHPQLRLSVENNVQLMNSRLSYQQGINGDIYYVNIEMVDEAGNLITDNDRELQVQLDNQQDQILGFGSGNPKPLKPFNSLRTTTFNGRALAIILKQHNQQPALLTVTGNNLPSKTITY